MTAIDPPKVVQKKPDIVVRPSKPVGTVQWLYTVAVVRVRAEPSTASAVVTTLPVGETVQSNGRQGDWHSVTVSAKLGWIRGDLLSSKPPPVAPPAAFVAQPAQEAPPKRSQAGEPIRDPYVGTCDCPYDRMRNGRRCGGNSAYSRPGGREPVCYF